MAKVEAASSSLTPRVRAKFWTKGPNVFTAAEGYFRDGSVTSPPIYAPSLLHQEELAKLDDKHKFWSDPAKWFRSGIDVRSFSNQPDDDTISVYDSDELFFDNWRYYEDVLMENIENVDEKVNLMLVDPDESSQDGQSSPQEETSELSVDELTQISPAVLMWVISVITLMSNSQKGAVPIIIEYSEGDYYTFDIGKHFGLRKIEDGSEFVCEKTTYFQMMLLTVDALFKTVRPQEPIVNSLMVDAQWNGLKILGNFLEDRLKANVEIEGRRYVTLDYEMFRHCFYSIFSTEVLAARLAADQFL